MVPLYKVVHYFRRIVSTSTKSVFTFINCRILLLMKVVGTGEAPLQTLCGKQNGYRMFSTHVPKFLLHGWVVFWPYGRKEIKHLLSVQCTDVSAILIKNCNLVRSDWLNFNQNGFQSIRIHDSWTVNVYMFRNLLGVLLSVEKTGSRKTCKWRSFLKCIDFYRNFCMLKN